MMGNKIFEIIRYLTNRKTFELAQLSNTRINDIGLVSD